jgi:hypothetical protein
MNGATATDPGRVGQAFSFDGADDYVANLGTPSTFAFIENTGIFTIEAWIKLNSPNAMAQQAISASTATTAEKGHFFIWDNLAGQRRLRLALMRGVSGSPLIDVSTPNDVIVNSSWHHVAAVGNGTNITFYVDGLGYPIAQAMGIKPSGDATRTVDIGRCPSTTPLCQFDGQIDELSIHDRALRPDEIQVLVHSGLAIYPPMCGTGCAQSVTGLVGWWPGQASAGDRSEFHNDGAAVAMSYPSGKVGTAFSLNGSSYVEVPDHASLEMTTQVTLAAWIQPSSEPLNHGGRILSKGQPLIHPYSLLLIANPLQLRSDISNDGMNYDALVAPPVLGVGVWTHVAMTFNAGSWKLYVNGSQAASATSSITALYAGGSSPVVIGRHPGGSNYFRGLIDEPMVFNRALSAAEIQSIYQAGSSGMCGLGLVVSVDEARSGVPGALVFAPPWPNPSTRMTHLGFHIRSPETVRVEVFDVAGRRVATLIDGQPFTAGEHRVTWDGHDSAGKRVAGGIYQIRLVAGERVSVRKIVLLTN